jgi:SAM-dependent methyltransferase
VSEKFEASWLQLREPVDDLSRAMGPLAPLQEWWSARGASSVLDLGAGTGSNLRWLSPRLSGPQRWTLVDHDAELLRRATAPGTEVQVHPVVGDLWDAGLAQVTKADLVTASALLDLVSDPWMGALADACSDAGSAAYFALTYDGSIAWSGRSDPLDEVVHEAVNFHQRRDKGLGPALGPTASGVAERLFTALGYETHVESSPWTLGPDDAALCLALVDGWAGAACEQRPSQVDAILQWAMRRREDVEHGDFGLVVGHQDLLALPPERK